MPAFEGVQNTRSHPGFPVAVVGAGASQLTTGLPAAISPLGHVALVHVTLVRIALMRFALGRVALVRFTLVRSAPSRSKPFK